MGPQRWLSVNRQHQALAYKSTNSKTQLHTQFLRRTDTETHTYTDKNPDEKDAILKYGLMSNTTQISQF